MATQPQPSASAPAISPPRVEAGPPPEHETPQEGATRSNVAPYAALAVLLLAAVTYHAFAMRDTIRTLRNPQGVVRYPFRIDPLPGSISQLEDEATTAGLRGDDSIVSVQGESYHGRKTLARALGRLDPGGALRLKVRRSSGGEHDAVVHLQGVPAPRAAERVVTFATGLVLPVISLGLGFFVAALRPRDARAWLLLLMMASFSQLSSEAIELGWPDGVRTFGLAYNDLMTGTWGTWMLLFGLRFPEPFEFDKRRPWLKWAVVTPLAVFAVVSMLGSVAAAEGWAWGAPFVAFNRALGRTAFFLTMPTVGGFFASMGARSGMATSSDARRRLLFVYFGASLGLTPMFILILLTRVAGVTVTSPWIVTPILLSLVLFPLSLAYAIVVQRALDVRVVVRQGLQYALARRGVMVLQFLVMVTVIVAASTLAGDPASTRPRRIQYVATGVAVLFLMQRAAERLRGWIDRRFFREAYDAEQVLTALSEDVRTIVETDRLLTTVGQRIASTLHIPKVAILLDESGSYAPAYAIGVGADAVRLAASSAVAARLRDGRQPLRVSLADRASWAWKEADASDRAALAALDAQLLLPLAVKDRLLGFVSLGPKQSEEPYSASDLRLLHSLASQTAIALENSHLAEAVARETALRARMDREIEIAREVQQGLFPQHYPPVAGVQYVGYCRPALGVGGDYYDFVAMGAGLGVAIGDISGKGIPAALLMASLQASLRAQAISSPTDLATLMARLNTLIFDASPANRYATFFYGQYDCETRRLDYVNAGHNAPMLFRRANGKLEVLRVDGGGPVIGLLPTARYEQHAVALQPGDLFVGFTDGISEAMNVQDEEWGEPQLIAAVEPCLDLHPREVVERVLAACDSFCTGAKQHDDMTLIVLKVVSDV